MMAMVAMAAVAMAMAMAVTYLKDLEAKDIEHTNEGLEGLRDHVRVQLLYGPVEQRRIRVLGKGIGLILGLLGVQRLVDNLAHGLDLLVLQAPLETLRVQTHQISHDRHRFLWENKHCKNVVK